MPTFRPIGPCRLYLGDPTPALGAGMTDLGDTENVGVTFGVQSAYVSSAQRQGTPLADSLYAMTPAPVVNAELTDAQNSIIAVLVQNSVTTTGVVGIGDSFALITSVPTLFLLPDTELASYETAANGIWMPAVLTAGLENISFGRVTAGEILQPYNVTFTSAYREEDQTTPTGVAIPVGNRVLFKGPPADLSLAWTVPNA